MKKAVLIFPKIDGYEVAQYPTGLYKIADFCKNDFDVIVIDQRLDDNLYDTLDFLLNNSQILCFGISLMTGSQIKYGIEIAKYFKNRTKIVFGGLHPTILPLQTYQYGLADFLIIGEGEKPFLELLKYLAGKKKHEKLFYNNENRNLKYNYQESLIDTAYIDFEKFPIDKSYFISRDRMNRAFNIETSRGCPHNCSFCCNSIFKKKYRVLSSEIVISTIKQLYEKYLIDGVIFQEDNFFGNIKEKTTPILKYLLENGNLRWKANSRINYFRNLVFDNDFMMDLIKSGCSVLQFGIESGSQRILNQIDKQIQIDDVILINKKLAMYNIRIRYNFIVGLPYEKPDDLHQTRRLIDKLLIDNNNAEIPFVNIYTPYPGTKMYQKALDCGFIEPINLLEWSNITWNSIDNKWYNPEVKMILKDFLINYSSKTNYLK